MSKSTWTQKAVSLLLLLAMATGVSACQTDGGTVTDATTTAPVITDKPADGQPPVTEPVTEPSTEPAPAEKSLLPRQAATEGMVLLKNEDKVLPLQKGSTVALFGKGQIELIKGGTGSGDVKTEHIVGVLEGLENKQTEGKLTVYSTLAKRYKANSAFVPRAADIKKSGRECRHCHLRDHPQLGRGLRPHRRSRRLLPCRQRDRYDRKSHRRRL